MTTRDKLMVMHTCFLFSMLIVGVCLMSFCMIAAWGEVARGWWFGACVGGAALAVALFLGLTLAEYARGREEA